jgi:hypothetical protein
MSVSDVLIAFSIIVRYMIFFHGSRNFSKFFLTVFLDIRKRVLNRAKNFHGKEDDKQSILAGLLFLFQQEGSAHGLSDHTFLF